MLNGVEKTLENGKRAENVGSYDFSTLYTKITHESLKTEIAEVVREAFEIEVEKGRKRLAEYTKRAEFAKKARKETKTYDAKDICDLLCFVY